MGGCSAHHWATFRPASTWRGKQRQEPRSAHRSQARRVRPGGPCHVVPGRTRRTTTWPDRSA
eukprot:4227599-Alexandrium_andersonii.AAC.1